MRPLLSHLSAPAERKHLTLDPVQTEGARSYLPVMLVVAVVCGAHPRYKNCPCRIDVAEWIRAVLLIYLGRNLRSNESHSHCAAMMFALIKSEPFCHVRAYGLN